MDFRIPGIHAVVGFTSATPALFHISLLQDYVSVTQSKCLQNLEDSLSLVNCDQEPTNLDKYFVLNNGWV